MRNQYSKEYTVDSFNTDFSYHATTLYLLGVVQDVAGCHGSEIGTAIPKLNKKNMTWVVSRTKLEIKQYPYWMEKIKANTIALKPNLFYFTRNVDLYHKNSLICKASSLWLVLDTKTFIPKKPSVIEEHFEPFETDIEPRINKIRKKYDFNEDYKLISENTIKVSPSYGDINNHVNNLHYFDWVVKSLTKELITDFSISLLDISWVKQTFVGDNINIKIYEKKLGKERNVIFKILKDNQIMCHGELEFKPRKSMIMEIKNPILIP